MPRPNDFTDTMKQECDAEMARYCKQQRSNPASVEYRLPEPLFSIPHFRETWYCGTWLDRKLAAVGVPRHQISDICFANGQKCAMAVDPWVPTTRTLAAFMDGQVVDMPGVELADRLLERGVE